MDDPRLEVAAQAIDRPEAQVKELSDALPDAKYLSNLAARLKDVPKTYGVFSHDVDRLRSIAMRFVGVGAGDDLSASSDEQLLARELFVHGIASGHAPRPAAVYAKDAAREFFTPTEAPKIGGGKE